MSRVRVFVAMSVAVLALAGAACGSSSSSSAGGGASSTPTSTPPVSTPPSSVSGGGGGGSTFCGEAASNIKDTQAKLAELAAIASTPARLKAEMQTLLTAYQKAIDQAPSEIKGDLQTVHDAINQLNQLLVQNAYNLQAVGAQGIDIFQSPKLQTAFKHLKAWGHANCGV